VQSRFVESVDLVPTVLDALGITAPTHRLEGASLLPLLRGEAVPQWREFTYSELDYSYRHARLTLGKDVHQCRAFSLRTSRWRYVYWLGEPEQLFDLHADPDEFHDLGRDASSELVRTEMRRRLLDFLARRRHRSTVSDEAVERGTGAYKKAGVFFGQW
jgi:arylsulfatase A-like enzyme